MPRSGGILRFPLRELCPPATSRDLTQVAPHLTARKRADLFSNSVSQTIGVPHPWRGFAKGGKETDGPAEAGPNLKRSVERFSFPPLQTAQRVDWIRAKAHFEPVVL